MYPDYEESLKITKREQEREFSRLNLERLKLIEKLDRLDKEIIEQGEHLNYTINQINRLAKYGREVDYYG